MGVDFSAVLFYGMPIDDESANNIDYDVTDGFNEANRQLEIANLSPMTDPTYVLFVRESYKSGDDTSDEMMVKLGNITGSEAKWQEWIEDACERLGVTYAPPDWYFATTFS